MSFFSLPRAGSVLTVAGLAVILAGCKGGETIGPDKKVAFIEIAPKSALLYAVGQTRQFSATLTTEAGTAGEGIEVGFRSSDPSLITVNSQGVATVKARGGSAFVIASAGGKADTAVVEVPATTCGSVTATTMAVGQVVTDIGEAGFCAAASASDYTVIVHNNSMSASGSSSIELTGIGVGSPPATVVASLARIAYSSRSITRMPQRDVAAEMRHRRAEALDVQRFGGDARAWYANRRNRATFAGAPPVVGSTQSINVNFSGSCSATPTMVDARVAAVSNTAIVLVDPRNPSSSFTDATYNEFAQMFDSITNPLAIAQFGVHTDLDNNQRVLLVFTKAVNERTPNNASYYVGGLTHSRDLLPKVTCAASNEAEMFYLLVPDPNATVNGNDDFTEAFVNHVTDATIVHEYQHLINFARRRYLLPNAPLADEELWLNEGLSHMAEELLFYRRNGTTSRANYGGSSFTSAAAYNLWAKYAGGDFSIYDAYLYTGPEQFSPFASGDDVETRGATWAFLRYLADQKLTADGTLWYDLVNSGQSGATNLQNRLGITSAGLLAMLRDFTISVYADDHVTSIPAKYTQPSWNMRSIYPPLVTILNNPEWVWPLSTAAINDGATTTATIRAGGFKVYRFRGTLGTEAFVRVKGASGAALPAGVTISVIRTQ